LADRIVVMNAGRVVQADSPLHVLAKPATPYVESLMDTKDAVRRLGLIRVRDAMSPADDAHPIPATQGSIGADQTLREALSLFLEGAERLSVNGTGPRGTLAFDDVRRAIALTEA
jgi:osmoprotectant transport system ATP-binding protein